MNTPTVSSRLPLQQAWPDALVARYREAGYWRGETFPAFLRERAERYADDIAVVAGDVRLSYAQLWHEAGRIGAGLLALGLQPGERVLVQLGNTAGFIATVCGSGSAGSWLRSPCSASSAVNSAASPSMTTWRSAGTSACSARASPR